MTRVVRRVPRLIVGGGSGAEASSALASPRASQPHASDRAPVVDEVTPGKRRRGKDCDRRESSKRGRRGGRRPSKGPQASPPPSDRKQESSLGCRQKKERRISLGEQCKSLLESIKSVDHKFAHSTDMERVQKDIQDYSVAYAAACEVDLAFKLLVQSCSDRVVFRM